MLVAQNIHYTYPHADEPALKGVSIRVAPGEVDVILGANGSGKSTLARVLAGSVAPTSGSVELDGKPVEHGWPHIGLVRQDPQAQLISEVVRDEVKLGITRHGLSDEEVELRASKVLDQCGIAHLAHMQTSDLSGGEQQRLALAGVLSFRPSYLVLDEPASQLDSMARRLFSELIVARARKGTGVAIVTHRPELITLAHRVFVMDEGSIVWEGRPDELYERDDILSLARLEDVSWSKGSPASRNPLYGNAASIVHTGEGKNADGRRRGNYGSESRGVTMLLDRITVTRESFYALREVSMRLGAGRIVLLSGRSGSGKTTLAHVAAGIVKPDAGTALLKGKQVRAGEVGLCQQHVEDQLFCNTVLEDVAFGPLNQGLSDTEAYERARGALAEMGVSDRLWERSPFTLSGGERRRVAIAGIIAMDPDVYVFDEPIAGLDGDGRMQARALMHRLADSGKAVLVISHDIEDWIEDVDDVVLLYDGRISYTGNASHISAAPQPFLQAGLMVPPVVVRRAAQAGQQMDGIPTVPSPAMSLRVSRITPLHRVPAGIKAAALIVATVLLFMTENLGVVLAATIASALLLATTHTRPSNALKLVRNIGIVLAFALVGNAIVLDGTADIPLWGLAGISSAGAYRGSIAVFRIIAIAWLAASVAYTTTSTELARALLKLLRPLRMLGVPLMGFEASITLALRCVPMAKDEFLTIEAAQLTRKAPLKTGNLVVRCQSWGSVLIPSIVTLMRRADELGFALRERGFGIDEKLD